MGKPHYRRCTSQKSVVPPHPHRKVQKGSERGKRGLSSNGTGMYAKGVDRYLPEMRLRRIHE